MCMKSGCQFEKRELHEWVSEKENECQEQWCERGGVFYMVRT